TIYFSMKEYLDNAMEQHFTFYMKENNFHFERFKSSSFGISYTFSNGHIRLVISKDRGLIETSLSSIHSENYFDINLIYNFHKSKNCDLSLEDFFGKNPQSNRLNLEQAAAFLQDQRNWITNIFKENNYIETEKDLHNLDRKSVV